MRKRWLISTVVMLTVAAVLALRTTAAPALAEVARFDWPQWQGRDRTAVSQETGLLDEWPKDGPRLLWKTKGMGIGYSTPSIAGGRIFLMGNKDKTDFLLCLSDSDNGKELWRRRIAETGRNNGGGYPGPRCTPTVDGDRVYALGLTGELVCCQTRDGKELSRKNLPKDFGGQVGGWQYSESPLVDGDKLIVTPGGGTATLVALDKSTGDTIWKSAVPGGDGAEYSSVIVGEFQGVRQYIQFVKKGVVAVNAADGKFLWRYDKPANGTANCSTPIFRDGLVFAASGYGTGGGLARLSKNGDVIKAEEVYFTKNMKNHHGGMVLVGEHLYGSNEGELVCLDFKSGEVKWRERRTGKGSIACADGKLYYRNEGSGDVFLVDASPTAYKERGKFKQPDRSGQAAWPHPVIANGKLYLRDQDTLLCYDLKKR